MTVSNRVVVAIAVVIVAAVGVEAYVQLQDIRELRLAIDAVSAKIDKTDATAMLASTTAAQAASRADQAQALAMAAKETADRAATDAAKAAGLAIVPPVPAPAQSTVHAATAADIAAGRDLALRVCAACHVVAPDQHFAPTLRPPAPDFVSIVNRPSTSDRSLRDFIQTPHGKMPDLTLVDYQMTALVDYMMSLRDHR